MREKPRNFDNDRQYRKPRAWAHLKAKLLTMGNHLDDLIPYSG